MAAQRSSGRGCLGAGERGGRNGGGVARPGELTGDQGRLREAGKALQRACTGSSAKLSNGENSWEWKG